jgi:hypothetical protein
MSTTATTSADTPNTADIGMSTTAATTPSTGRSFKRTIGTTATTTTTITAPTATHITTDHANLRAASIKPHWQLNHRTLPSVVLGLIIAVVFTVMAGLYKRRRVLQDGDVSSSDIALLELDGDDLPWGSQPSGDPAVGSVVQLDLQHLSSGAEGSAVIATETWKSMLNLDVTIAGNPPPPPGHIAESSWLGQAPSEMMEVVSDAKIARALNSVETFVAFPTPDLFDGYPSNTPASLVGDGSGSHHYHPSTNKQMSVHGNAVHNVFDLANQQVALPPVRQAQESISVPNVDALRGLCSDQDLQHSAETRVPLHLTQMHLDILGVSTGVCASGFTPSPSPPTSTYSASHEHKRPPSRESSSQDSQDSAKSSSDERDNIEAEFTGTDLPSRTPDGNAWSKALLAMSAKERNKVSKQMRLSPNQHKELKLSSRKYKQQLAQVKFMDNRRHKASSTTASRITQKGEAKIIRHNITRDTLREVEEQEV